MTLSAVTERKVLAFITLFAASVSAGLVVREAVALHKDLAEAASHGIFVDVSADPTQFNARVVIALVFAGLCLWSKRASMIAVIAATLFFGLCEALSWSATGVFDRTEIEIHFAALAALTGAIALTAVKHRRAQVINALLACLFILTNYGGWIWYTARLERIAEGGLYPRTPLNQILYGARPWHVPFLLFTVVVLGWTIRLLFRERWTGPNQSEGV